MDWRPRFWKKVDRSAMFDCWKWLGWKDEKGYGRFDLAHRPHALKVHAHRLAYELAYGPIPSGLTIDHLCRVTGCVNPAHLEAVTIQENCARARKLSKKN